MQRRLFTYLALVLGALMILVGLLSFLGRTPHPEIATGGATLMLATGLLSGNGRNGKR